MKAVLRVDGNDGSRGYSAGATYEGDGEWIRKQLINGLADPADDDAAKVVASAHQRERYRNASLIAAAKEIRPAKEIPALQK